MWSRVKESFRLADFVSSLTCAPSIIEAFTYMHVDVPRNFIKRNGERHRSTWWSSTQQRCSEIFLSSMCETATRTARRTRAETRRLIWCIFACKYLSVYSSRRRDERSRCKQWLSRSQVWGNKRTSQYDSAYTEHRIKICQFVTRYINSKPVILLTLILAV